MIKTLSKVGNSQALILDKTMLELIGVGERGEVELQVQGDTLLVRPARSDARRLELERIGGELMDRFDDAYRRLATP
jgi:antitoxin component of MazEF toxin-antitoxin module